VKKLDNDVIGVLSRLSYDEHDGATVAFITDGQLDRKLYVKLNDVLTSFGGKWNKKVKGHIFAENPNDKIDGVILSGEFVDSHAFDFFETPPELARRMVGEAGIADLKDGARVLEPSAGRGAICDAIMASIPVTKSWHFVCYELREDNRRVLAGKGYHVNANDFMEVIPPHLETLGYDAVVMNPPFSKQQDIDHVLHAYEMLRPGGKLVAIMSAGTKWRENKKAQAFRDRVQECGYWVDLPQQSFKASGTLVNTIMVVLKK
jgi:hypothetical protein